METAAESLIIARSGGVLPVLGRFPRSIREVLNKTSDKELGLLYERAQRAFDEIASRGLPSWIVTFSGGKDSTLTALLATDYLARMQSPPQLTVVYSDTLLEVPQMRHAAGSFLRYLEVLAKEDQLPIRALIVQPELSNRFWVRMIGRGYPPPKPKFRWCTHRLKILPASPIVKTQTPTAVLTGVRYGESAKRTGRLLATCATGGECGQDYWAQKGPKGSNITYFAPIINWPTCKVWDFLHFVAPQAGWPTQSVYNLYGDSNLRFGCWTCTLVTRDKTVEALIQRNPRSPLQAMHEFRQYFYEESTKRRNRWMRSGHLGPLNMTFRRTLLEKLLKLQRDTNMSLISDEEIAEIRRLWATKFGLPPSRRGRRPR